jgi:hypothetical protein
VLVEDGSPVMAYKVGSVDEASTLAGMEAIKKFISRFHDRKHLVMLYDDPKLARRVEFEYIKQGLQNEREQCIYMIPEDDVETTDSITRQMNEYGIDTMSYLRKGTLQIVRIDDPAKDRNGFLLGCTKILNSLTAKAKTMPMRVVLHVKYRFDSIEELDSHAGFEQMIQSSFSQFDGSMLCYHYVGHRNYEDVAHRKWVKRMLQTHSNVFFGFRPFWYNCLRIF